MLVDVDCFRDFADIRDSSRIGTGDANNGVIRVQASSEPFRLSRQLYFFCIRQRDGAIVR